MKEMKIIIEKIENLMQENNHLKAALQDDYVYKEVMINKLSARFLNEESETLDHKIYNQVVEGVSRLKSQIRENDITLGSLLKSAKEHLHYFQQYQEESEEEVNNLCHQLKMGTPEEEKKDYNLTVNLGDDYRRRYVKNSSILSIILGGMTLAEMKNVQHLILKGLTSSFKTLLKNDLDPTCADFFFRKIQESEKRRVCAISWPIEERDISKADSLIEVE